MMKFSDMIDSGYFMYMAEREGMDSLVSTREAKINAIINDCQKCINAGENPINYINDIINRHGLTYEGLTDDECKRISSLRRY